MKQVITIEQINELSEDKILLLNDWMNNHNYNTFWIQHDVKPLMTIGQMIEFLGYHTNGIYSYPVIENDGKKYLQSQFIDGNEIETLCDWLWEAVKEILNK